jgi:hypothetical protein
VRNAAPSFSAISVLTAAFALTIRLMTLTSQPRGSGSDAVIAPNGELEVLGFWEGYLGYSHYWTESLNSTISTAWTEVDNSEFQLDDAIHSAGSFHLNMIWFPYKLASTGFEIMWGERVNKNGVKGEAWRLQYMSKFKFN